MNIASKVTTISIISIVCYIILAPTKIVLAVPDSHLRPRSIETYIRNRVARDTLRLENRGDEDLEWEVDIEAEQADHMSISPESGTVEPDERAIIVLTQDGRDIEDGDHFFADLVFTTNDPNAEEIEVPVASHRVVYPIIGVSWPDGWGEWWGIEMNNFIRNLEWGDDYNFNITIHNYGWAGMDVDDLNSNNGYFTFDTTEFHLNPRSNRQVRVTFSAEEVGQNSAEITSESDAWDPRELQFRIVGVVEPVYRKGSEISDVELIEDADDTLIVDLDDVFISSNRSRVLVVDADDLHVRIERNGNLFLRPHANWFGVNEVVASAALDDSVLTDTFLVVVQPVEDPPDRFDLVHPADGDTIHFGGVDTLDLFIWQAAEDPDGDTVSYSLHITPSDMDTTFIWRDLTDTEIPRSILQEVISTETGGLFEWTVLASDGDLTNPAWSVFTNYVPPAGIWHDESIPDFDYELVSVYPNPFNAGLNIDINSKTDSGIEIRIYNLNGRLIENFYTGRIPAGRKSLTWRPILASSGSYIIRVDFDRDSFAVPVVLSK